MIKVYIIDDHQLILEGLRSLLQDEKELSLTGFFKNAASLLSQMDRNPPDVILMDINLPQIDGLQLCKVVVGKFPSVKVIGLSTSDQISIIRKMFECGASGYLLKDAGKNEIIEAIETVCRGRQYINHSIAEVIKKTDKQAQGLPQLTRREKEILELIAEGLTNAQIAMRLFITVTTVDSHRKNMLNKFGVNNTAALIKLAVTHQLI